MSSANTKREGPSPYEAPTLVILGTLSELTKTGAVAGKEHGGNGRLPITLSNP